MKIGMVCKDGRLRYYERGPEWFEKIKKQSEVLQQKRSAKWLADFDKNRAFIKRSVRRKTKSLTRSELVDMLYFFVANEIVDDFELDNWICSYAKQ